MKKSSLNSILKWILYGKEPLSDTQYSISERYEGIEINDTITISNPELVKAKNNIKKALLFSQLNFTAIKVKPEKEKLDLSVILFKLLMLDHRTERKNLSKYKASKNKEDIIDSNVGYFVTQNRNRKLNKSEINFFNKYKKYYFIWDKSLVLIENFSHPILLEVCRIITLLFIMLLASNYNFINSYALYISEVLLSIVFLTITFFPTQELYKVYVDTDDIKETFPRDTKEAKETQYQVTNINNNKVNNIKNYNTTNINNHNVKNINNYSTTQQIQEDTETSKKILEEIREVNKSTKKAKQKTSEINSQNAQKGKDKELGPQKICIAEAYGKTKPAEEALKTLQNDFNGKCVNLATVKRWYKLADKEELITDELLSAVAEAKKI